MAGTKSGLTYKIIYGSVEYIISPIQYRISMPQTVVIYFPSKNKACFISAKTEHNPKIVSNCKICNAEIQFFCETNHLNEKLKLFFSLVMTLHRTMTQMIYLFVLWNDNVRENKASS